MEYAEEGYKCEVCLQQEVQTEGTEHDPSIDQLALCLRSFIVHKLIERKQGSLQDRHFISCLQFAVRSILGILTIALVHYVARLTESQTHVLPKLVGLYGVDRKSHLKQE